MLKCNDYNALLNKYYKIHPKYSNQWSAIWDLFKFFKYSLDSTLALVAYCIIEGGKLISNIVYT